MAVIDDNVDNTSVAVVECGGDTQSLVNVMSHEDAMMSIN